MATYAGCMLTLTKLLFLSAFACLLSHEIDAVRQHEWRLLFVLRKMDDRRAFFWFTLLHAPLFVLMLWWLDHPRFQLAFDLFALGHMAAHWYLRKHPANTFNNPLSISLIAGAGICGAAHLLLTLIHF